MISNFSSGRNHATSLYQCLAIVFKKESDLIILYYYFEYSCQICIYLSNTYVYLTVTEEKECLKSYFAKLSCIQTDPFSMMPTVYPGFFHGKTNISSPTPLFSCVTTLFLLTAPPPGPLLSNGALDPTPLLSYAPGGYRMYNSFSL